MRKILETMTLLVLVYLAFMSRNYSGGATMAYQMIAQAIR